MVIKWNNSWIKFSAYNERSNTNERGPILEWFIASDNEHNLANRQIINLLTYLLTLSIFVLLRAEGKINQKLEQDEAAACLSLFLRAY